MPMTLLIELCRCDNKIMTKFQWRSRYCGYITRSTTSGNFIFFSLTIGLVYLLIRSSFVFLKNVPRSGLLDQRYITVWCFCCFKFGSGHRFLCTFVISGRNISGTIFSSSWLTRICPFPELDYWKRPGLMLSECAGRTQHKSRCPHRSGGKLLMDWCLFDMLYS